MPHLSPASTLCCVLADTLASLQPSVASCLGKLYPHREFHITSLHKYTLHVITTLLVVTCF